MSHPLDALEATLIAALKQVQSMKQPTDSTPTGAPNDGEQASSSDDAEQPPHAAFNQGRGAVRRRRA